MADFHDSADPELGPACNRLAAWVEPLSKGLVIDHATGLSETDLVRILGRLHATRQYVPIPVLTMAQKRDRYGTARPNVHGAYAAIVKTMSEAERVAAYRRKSKYPGVDADALLVEITSRNLDI